MTIRLTDEKRLQRTQLIEKHLRDGLPPPHLWREAVARHSATATSAAAQELGIEPELLRRQIKKGSIPLPDWTLWRGFDEVEKPHILELKVRRLQQEAKLWQSEKKAYQDEILTLQDTRSIFKGVADSLSLPKVQVYSKPIKSSAAHTALIDISDLHFGARVHLEELNGLNAYSIAICKARMRRLCRKVIYLLKEHTNVTLERLVVLLKGDLISGGMFLHEETGRTDECQPIEQVKGVAEIITEVLMGWLQALKIPIDVYCVPGNHGRTTKKNEPSQMVANSLDITACQFVETCFRGNDNITFHYPASGEAVFKIYSKTCLAIHGHMGFHGGGGVYGPTYTMVRGGMKTRMNYEHRGTSLDYIFIGHFHSSLRPLSFLYANGSVIGPDPYSMTKLKAIPEPAQQSLFLFNRKRGIVDWREIQLGAPEEGTLYA